MYRPTQPAGVFIDAAHARRWRFVGDWHVELSDGSILYVRDGYIIDGASVPRILWTLVGPPFCPSTLPGVAAHDALYDSELLSQIDADREMRRLIELTMWPKGDMPGWDDSKVRLRWLGKRNHARRKARTYYFGVRLGGWYPWSRHTEESIAAARRYVSIKPAMPHVDFAIKEAAIC